ncbi:MAG: outer membrane lipoprotein carrier protein LolA [Polyangiaceae bacterium]|nr:outer membrane lipoprotein carrier protein LolA [Polyangiaceae bacterium]
MHALVRRVSFALAALLVFASIGAAGEVEAQAQALDRLLAGFRRVPGLSAEFREEKAIAMLREPVVSTGRLYFSPPALLARHILSPTPSSMVLDGSTLSYGDARSAEAMDLDANPAARALVDVFRAVLAGDREALLRSFEASVTEESGGWRMRLRPKDRSVQRILTSIELTGSGVVLRTIDVHEASGDVSRTTFTNVNPNRRFSRAERRRIFRVGGG